MSYYPIFVDLNQKKVLVVGGGKVAQRKVETFLQYGASVHVISEELTPRLDRYVKEGRIKLVGNEFTEESMTGAVFIVAATDNQILNSRIGNSAKKAGIMVNVVDQPADCSFIVPSIVRKGDLQIAVSTSGKSPALAKKLREDLDKQFGSHYETFLVIMGKLRDKILEMSASTDDKSRIFNEIVNSSVLDAVKDEDWERVASILSSLLGHTVRCDDIKDYLEV
ncbi:MAG: bifunctional precorrin-2 dehydrogenase/sirohydrochlorin ferrochelatase [Deltaproteobacteria bacterium]|nr:bifunctional precorrin-2 dehydrogenase/sirohydrochlorin ferrochelatase [Deltaproteobacteria bacterium]